MKKIEVDPMIQEQIKTQYLSGTPGPALAKQFGYSVDKLYRCLRGMGVRPSVIGAERGLGAHGKPKIDESGQAEVGRLYRRGLSMRKLARQYEVTEKTIRRILKKGNVEARSRHSRPIDDELMKAITADWLSELLVSDILAKHKISTMRLRRVLLAAGLDPRAERPSGVLHWHFKGGRRVTSSNYVQVMMPKDHPFYLEMSNPDGYVMEHRLVMAESIGRPLRKEETVHHKDGNRQNNARPNLELHQNLHGKDSKWVCADCGSHNIVPSTLGGLAEQ